MPINTKYLLIKQEVAEDFARQIVNRFLHKTGLPAIGIGKVFSPSVVAIKNKARQANWRIGKPRLTAWETEDTAAILAPVKIKLAALAEAKRIYRHQLGLQHRAEQQARYWQSKGKTARANTYIEQAYSYSVVVALKLILYNAAKIA